MPAGPTVVVSSGPPNEAWTTLIDYAGGSLVTYTGLARSEQEKVQFVVTSVSKASPGVVTVTAHGLVTGQKVHVAGATGDWAGLNGDQTATVTGVNTFTLGADSTLFAGSFDGVITTTAPLITNPCWAIQKNFYDGTSQLINQMWADGSVGTVKIWDNRTTLSYQ